jgi:energy-coupling factor transport system substrate-specific component
MRRAFVVAPLAATGAAAAWTAIAPEQAGVALLLLAAGLIVAGTIWFESGPASTREITLIATLAAVAAAGRVLFAAVPGVQPVTVIALATGAALGLRAGVTVGALAALVSNLFLGQGPWTPWQILGWAGCGAVGALAAPALRRRLPFAVAAFACGFAFSTLMDLWLWLSFWPHTWEALTVVLARGVWFSGAHAVGNVLIALAVGPELGRMLERYGRRLRTEIAWA